ncbi:MAG: hypothetical protein LUD77_00090 [Clostridiales bacterium]|nr:hypothetical protein [Clostridiales bacterium]
MDLLEYKQIAEAVNYVENYNYNNDIKFSDVNYDKKLSDFEIKDETVGYRTIGEGNDRYKISYGYNNGCTEGQIKLFRMILLSAKYNYNELESDLLSETDKQQIKEDVSKGEYKGKNLMIMKN